MQLRPYSTPVQPRKSMEWDPSNLGNSNTSLFPQHSAPVKWAITRCLESLSLYESNSGRSIHVFLGLVCVTESLRVFPPGKGWPGRDFGQDPKGCHNIFALCPFFFLWQASFKMLDFLLFSSSSCILNICTGVCVGRTAGERGTLWCTQKWVLVLTDLLPLALQTNYKMAESIQEITNLTSTNVYWGLCMSQALRHKDDDVSWNTDFMALKLFGILEIIQQINIVKKRKVTQLTKYKSISEILWILF